jgi:aryl-alcohol dehydrogenase-like predicted oxidoreductase
MTRTGRSVEFLGTALRGRRSEAVIATKFTARRADDIDLYYQHHPDPAAPDEELLEVFARLVGEGKVLHTAVSNAGKARAHLNRPSSRVITLTA